jgi:hypothetical protein
LIACAACTGCDQDGRPQPQDSATVNSRGHRRHSRGGHGTRPGAEYCSILTRGNGQQNETTITPARSYSVSFSASGYQSQTLAAVVTTGNNAPLNATLVPLPTNSRTAGVTVDVTSAGAPAGGATVELDFADGSTSITQTDATGAAQFTNQLTGVAVVVKVTLSDGITTQSQSSSGFATGCSAAANLLTFTF